MSAKRSLTKAPPSRALAARQVVMGSVVAGLGGTSIALGLASAGVPLVLFGGAIASVGGLLWISGNAVPLVNGAYNAVLRGRIAEAEAMLDQAERGYQLSYIRRAIDLQRAALAMRRGDLDGARTRVEAAITRRTALLTRSQERVHILGARAMRALVRASQGDVEGARDDVRAVRATPTASAEMLARAEVAEAIALERTGDRDALAAHLASKRALLLDYTMPRERAVVRAFQRMLRAPKTSIYRKSAPRDEQAPSNEPTVADWIAKIAPAAAPFARATKTRANASDPTAGARVDAARAQSEPRARVLVEPHPDDVSATSIRGGPPQAELEAGLRRIAKERISGANARRALKNQGRVLVLWLVLVALLVFVWNLLRSGPGTDSLLPSVHFDVGLVAAAVCALLAGFVAVLVRRNFRNDRRLTAALGALARGERDALDEITALTKTPTSVAAHAYLELARVAERRADFAEALKRCDLGIAAATVREATRVSASTIILPELVAERAFLLAARGQHDKARAEMAVLAESFPAFPYLARAELRVDLVQRAASGDVEGAAKVASAAAEDIPLSLRDETLADLVRAVADPDAAATGEVERLKQELRLDPELVRWLDAVAPSVLATFESASRGTTSTLDVERDIERDIEREAEIEALAEDELHRDGARAALRE